MSLPSWSVELTRGKSETKRLTTVSVIKGVGVQERGAGGDGGGRWLDVGRKPR